MIEENPRIKIAFLGGPAVGKTSIINNFLKKRFEEHPATIHASCFHSTNTVNGKDVDVDIWDTAGQEQYRSIGSIYYRDAGAAICVYDLTSQKSFDVLDEYVNDYLDCVPNGIVVIAANKFDMVQENSQLQEQGYQYAETQHFDFFVTSAKTGQSIPDLFNQVILNVLEARNESLPKPVNLDGDSDSNKKSCNC